MPTITTPQHAVLVALAAGALLASPAVARPSADDAGRMASGTSSLAGTVTPKQDLRGEHARDAARAATGELPAASSTPLVQPERVTDVAPPAQPAGTAGTGGGDADTWLVLGIGLAGAGLVGGGAAGLTRHIRVRARRIAA